ncbi:succinylglutamate desuccinylase, partial [Vibrio furnissii]
DGDKPLMAKNEGEAIVFPNRHVAIGQRAALMVCTVDTRYEDDQLVYD